MRCDLTNRVIAVTGASSGIGAATAVACAAAGMDVALQARREERLQEVAAQVEKTGRGALIVLGDVDRDEDVDRLIAETTSRFGRLDAVFANAGFGLFGAVADAAPQQARAIFETNFFGTMRLIRAALPVMRRQGSGHILICSSAVSEIGLPMNGLYCATKAAQDSIASAMRAELADEKIHVSSVHPVGTSTEFYEVLQIRSGLDGKNFNTPSALIQTPEKVARAIVRCLRRPRPEVWPHLWSRFGLALVTAFPVLNERSMRSMMRKRYRGAKARCATP